MKRKKNMIMILCIGLLLFGAYTVPEALTQFEDNRLQSKTRSFEIEEISFQSNEVNTLEELEIFQEMLADNIVVKQEYASMQEDTSSENNLNYATLQKNVEAFLSLLNIQETPDFQSSYVSYIVMTDIKSDKVYSLRKCYAIDENKNEYVFWLDGTTGKVMAYEIPAAMIQMNLENFKMTADNLAEYYGVPYFDFLEKNGELTSEVWEMAYYSWNEEEGTELLLPIYKFRERITFNMYPGDVSTTTATSSY